MLSSNRIDVHHHFIPPKYGELVAAKASKEWPSPSWSLAASQSVMKDRGIATGILSLTSPGVDLAASREEQIAVAQDANNTGAAARDANPSQFGFFVTIPNPVRYQTDALEEIRRAFDDLHADGITLLTSYSGKYLGDEVYAPLWKELNRRKAVVFIHPTSPPGDYIQVSRVLLPPVLDFTFETTKAACDLIMSGAFARNRDLKIILSHAGGNLPFIWHRVAQLPKSMKMGEMDFEDFRDQARSFYFDLALTGWGDNIELLLKFAKKGHVLYGSDFPYAPTSCIEDMTEGLDKLLETKDASERNAINWGNALELFPRLAAYHTKKTSQSKM